MGCDIHFYVEAINKDNNWESIDKWTVDKDKENPIADVNYEDKFYSGRNYSLFSILANVRNSGLSAGSLNYIAEPKGIPADSDSRYKFIAAGPDWHSHSYLTLKEILEFDWTQTFEKVQEVCLKDWSKSKHRNLEIDMSVYRKRENKLFTEEQFEKAWKQIHVDIGEEPDGSYYKIWQDVSVFNRMTNSLNNSDPWTTIKIPETYVSMCDNFWLTTIPRMIGATTKLKINYEQIRTTFFFDN